MNIQYFSRSIAVLIAASLSMAGCNADATKESSTKGPQSSYRQLEVKYAGGDSKTLLAGTLSLPYGDGPFPGVLLISGSGPQDRDETVGPFKPFAILAEALNRQGYAVLRYDDRGVGQSSGDYSTATLDDFAVDAVSGMGYLRADAHVDPGCIVLVGHSEGGYIAPLAAQTLPPQAIVLLAGAAQAMSEIFLTQLQTLNYPDEDPEQIAALLESINTIVTNVTDLQLAAQPIDAILEAAGMPADERQDLVGLFASPWWQRYLNFQPGKYLSVLDMPVLALYGEKDMQVRATDNAQRMQSFLLHPGSQVEVLPGMNHLFQQAVTGLPGEYFTLPAVFEVGMRERMIDWLASVLPDGCGLARLAAQ